MVDLGTLPGDAASGAFGINEEERLSAFRSIPPEILAQSTGAAEFQLI